MDWILLLYDPEKRPIIFRSPDTCNARFFLCLFCQLETLELCFQKARQYDLNSFPVHFPISIFVFIVGGGLFLWNAREETDAHAMAL